VTSITASSPLTGGVITTSGSIGCQTASGSLTGCLSSADWTTFNSKQAAGSYLSTTSGNWAGTWQSYNPASFLQNLLGGLNGIFGNSTTTNATTTTLGITGLSNTFLAVNGNGSVMATTTPAGSQTPWTSDINGGNHLLTNVNEVMATYLLVSSYFWQSSSTQASRILGPLIIGATTTASNGLTVIGDGFFSGNLKGANLTATGTLNVVGTTTVTSDLLVGSSTAAVSFYVDPTTGNVGVGTSTPATALVVIGTTTSTGIKVTKGSSYSGQAVCYLADGSFGHQNLSQLTSGTCVAN
jgi:hypothetical protein